MIGEVSYGLPAQLVVLEQGPTGGLPAAGAVISSDHFDTVWTAPNDVIIPQMAGGKVNTLAGFPQDGLGVRFAACYYLDVYVSLRGTDQTSKGTIKVFGAVPASLGDANVTFTEHLIARFLFEQRPPADGGTAANQPPTFHRVRIPVRFFRLQITLPPAGNFQYFAAGAYLRAE